MALKFTKLPLFCIFALSLGGPVYAGEAEFGITSEFLTICDDQAGDPESIAQRFSDNGWVKGDPEIGDALKPDDFLKKVKSYSPFEVELADGGAWYGSSAKGKIGSDKVGYCALIAIDDDLVGYRTDFERASELSASNTVDIEIEKRYIYDIANSGDRYFMREISTPDVSYFVYIKLYILDPKGKK